MATKGSCGNDKDHTASLYWLVKKVDKEDLANLEIDIASFTQEVLVHLPAFKKGSPAKELQGLQDLSQALGRRLTCRPFRSWSTGSRSSPTRGSACTRSHRRT